MTDNDNRITILEQRCDRYSSRIADLEDIIIAMKIEKASGA